MEAREAINEMEERIRRTNDRRLYERLQVIRLWLMDMPVKQIALTLCRSDKTVRAYIHAYQDRGFDGLIMKRAPGKACRLTQLSILVEPVQKARL